MRGASRWVRNWSVGSGSPYYIPCDSLPRFRSDAGTPIGARSTCAVGANGAHAVFSKRLAAQLHHNLTMPRIPYVPADLPGPIADAIRARRGERGLIALDRALLHSPAIAEGWSKLLGAVRTSSSLQDDVREIMVRWRYSM